MQKLDNISEDLFKKLRSRFPNITIGDENGKVTNNPLDARFFDFSYTNDGTPIGKVSVSIDEETGLSVIFSNDIVEFQDDLSKKNWFNFLKELRVFSKKRMLDFSIRDINKSNLTKKDYNFLAKTPEDGQMTESKLYGTSRISYQKVGEARIVVKHTESINQESVAGRTQKIGKIYIESADGERFRYPYKHLSGARAMARHVAEGGKPYDDFGGHIIGLSEEMNKLRKFKNYMGRSAVMAESLAGYVDVVKERIDIVKKTIGSLQKPAYYAEAFAAFETPMMEDVPADVAENWIDQLTIKQFNEELADVFPYIYKLVSEATRAKELGPDDLDEVAGPDKCWDGYKKDGTQPGTGKNKGKRVNKCVPEEIALEQGFEEMMGQFGEERTDEFLPALAVPALITAARVAAPKLIQMGAKILTKGAQGAGVVAKGAGKVAIKNPGTTAAVGGGAYVGKKAGDAIDAVGDMAGDLATSASDLIAKAEGGVEAIQGEISAFLGGGAVKQVAAMAAKYALPALAVVALLYGGKKVIDMLKSKDDDNMQTASMEAKECEECNCAPCECDEDTEEGNAYAHAVKQAKMNGKKKGDKVKGPDGDEITLEKDQKTPLGEFILSYYDKESGEFPKGETAVLTMVEKDYGEQFIEPAKAFIEQVQALFDEYQMEEQPQHMDVDLGFDRMKELAGVR